jgi:hypothetical protein
VFSNRFSEESARESYAAQGIVEEERLEFHIQFWAEVTDGNFVMTPFGNGRCHRSAILLHYPVRH